MTKQGRRWYFKYRQADGSSSSKRGFTSRRAAVQAKQALEESVRRGEVKISRDTFAQYWARFLLAKRPYVTGGTLFDYTMHGEKRLVPAFGERKLCSIERADVRAWLAQMADVVEAGALAAKTVNNALTLLSVCFNQAIDDGLIVTNPCQRIKRLPEATFERDFLRLHEIAPYLAACPDYYRDLAGLLIGGGCRVSEAIALRWQDVDLGDASVRISRQRDRVSDATTQTKGKRFRRVDIGPGLTDELRRLRAARMAGGTDDGGWLFLCPPPVRGRYVGRLDPRSTEPQDRL